METFQFETVQFKELSENTKNLPVNFFRCDLNANTIIKYTLLRVNFVVVVVHNFVKNLRFQSKIVVSSFNAKIAIFSLIFCLNLK